MASRAVDKMLRFFNEGQEAVLSETAEITPRPKAEEEDGWRWDSMNEKLEIIDVDELVGASGKVDDGTWRGI
jgi:hypothetical protein